MANKRSIQHKLFKCRYCSLEFDDNIKFNDHFTSCTLKCGLRDYV